MPSQSSACCMAHATSARYLRSSKPILIDTLLSWRVTRAGFAPVNRTDACAAFDGTVEPLVAYTMLSRTMVAIRRRALLRNAFQVVRAVAFDHLAT